MSIINHQAEGHASTVDNDLLDLEVAYAATLPWLREVLQEIQCLRNCKVDLNNDLDDERRTIAHLQTSLRMSEEDADCMAEEDADAETPRVKYLEGVLDKLGASYNYDEFKQSIGDT